MADVAEVTARIPDPVLKDVPAVSNAVDAAVRDPLSRLREQFQVLAGLRGDKLDMAVTFRALMALGAIDATGTFVGGSGGVEVPGPPGPIGPPGAPAPGTTPDLTPPPTPTGTTAIAGFSQVIVQWDAPAYTVGHGHGQTNIYAVKKAADDPTLPTFGDAVLVDSAPGALTIRSLDSDLGIRWHIWTKHQTKDGVESSAPDGGTNGVVAQTGKIGNTDLGPLIITADKLSAGTYDGVNLVRNPGAEDGTVAWALVEGTAGTFTADTTDKTSGSASFKATKTSTGVLTGYGSQAFPVIPGETYSVKVRVRASAATANGLYVQMFQRATAPSGGYVTAALRTSWTDLAANVAMTTGWRALEYTYTVPAGIYWVSLVINNAVGGALSQWWDDASVGRQITASFLAAGSIAVGSAAIADGAIRRALIELAAIDDARIANLSAAKLTVGDGTIGGNLKSSNYAGGSAGWIVRPDGYAEFGFAAIRGTLLASQIAANFVTATMIDSRNLTIKDGSGNIIFGASQNLDWARINGQALGVNLVYNSAFDAGIDGWVLHAQNLISPADAGVNLNDSWRLAPAGNAGTSVLWSHQNGRNGTAGAYYEYRNTQAIPVTPGARYVLSAYTGAHRCQVTVFVRVYNSSGALIQDGAASSDNNQEASGGQTLSGYKRQSNFVDIVAGAAYAVVFLRKYDTAAGQPDSYLFATRVQFELVGAGGTTPGPWSDAPVTDRTAVRALNPITAANVSTYIQSAAIGNAQIGGVIQSNDYVSGSAGWSINKGGSVEFNNGTFRGNLAAANGTFSGILTAAAVNAVDSVNIINGAVTAYAAVAGTGATVSTAIGIPAGIVMEIAAIATADGFSNGTSPTSGTYPLTVDISGASATNYAMTASQYLGETGGDSGTPIFNYIVGPVTCQSLVGIAGPATVTISASSGDGRVKRLIVLGRKR